MSRLALMIALAVLFHVLPTQAQDFKQIVPRTDLLPISSLTISDEQFLKNDPNGFKVTQSVVTVNGEKMLQIHVTLNLTFVDSLNKIQEQTVESKVFVRNLQ